MNMKSANTDWTREELIVAFNLYCKTPFSKINGSLPSIVKLASMLGRSPASVAFKLLNFARLDPGLQERHIVGFSHGSKLEVDIWNEFKQNGADLAFRSEEILAKLQGKNVEEASSIDTSDLPMEGKERSTLVKTRVNQQFFRRMVLACYNNSCCVSGINIPELLVASHIIPWSIDEKNRMNPQNGLCLNALYDKAFDTGLITITTEYKIKVSETLRKYGEFFEKYFLPYNEKEIRLPKKFPPVKEFLEYHNKHIFIDMI